MEIDPPIADRGTEELIDIVETKEQWEPEMVELAQKELTDRGIPINALEMRRNSQAKYNRRIEAIKAGASYTTMEKILIVLFGPILIIILDDIFTFDTGDGFKRKNRQGIFYLVLGIILWGSILYFLLTSS